MEELNTITRMEVNALAALLYQMNGYMHMEDYDFSSATHPREKLSWNQALVAFSVVKKDSWYLQFQIG